MSLSPQAPKTPGSSEIFSVRQCGNLGLCPSAGEGGGGSPGPQEGLVAGHSSVTVTPFTAPWPGGLAHLEDPRAGPGGGSALKQARLGSAVGCSACPGMFQAGRHLAFPAYHWLATHSLV